jgi:single-stranded-DNA-specific exonuclease
MPARSRWIPRSVAPTEFLAELPTGLSPLIGHLLWNRQITESGQVQSFLSASYSDLHNASLLKDMDHAVQRIRQAVNLQQTVAVYGDFDTDGVTGVALLKQALNALGLQVIPYIPHRITEGYGLNLIAVEQLAQQAQLLITVDCGISNVEEIARAQSLGLDVIVLDHHTPPASLPPAYAIINPKRSDCSYPYDMLAGVGVAYKLVQGLHRSGLRLPIRGRDMLDLVALGTVTDMAPLNGENRILVKHGLNALNKTERIGIRALLEAASVQRRIDARTIGFTLGPRINAAGRLDNAVRAYKLLLAETESEAVMLADELNKINQERQALTRAIQQRAEAMALVEGKAEQRIIILASEEFPSGIVGLVAARLVETFGRPVLVLERGVETSRGSARSVDSFSIINALTEVGDLLQKFGGHTMAAGFTIRNADLPEFETRIAQIAARDLPEELLESRLRYDAELPLAAITPDLADQIALLEPFGHGNPQPVWVSRNLRVLLARPVGREQQHLKLRLSDGKAIRDAIWWRCADQLSALRACTRIDIAYTLECEEYRGTTQLQLAIKDVRPSD